MSAVAMRIVRIGGDSDPVIAFRCPPSLLEAVECERARRAALEPGVRTTRSDVVRSLILLALDGGGR